MTCDKACKFLYNLNKLNTKKLVIWIIYTKSRSSLPGIDIISTATESVRLVLFVLLLCLFFGRINRSIIIDKLLLLLLLFDDTLERRRGDDSPS